MCRNLLYDNELECLQETVERLEPAQDTSRQNRNGTTCSEKRTVRVTKTGQSPSGTYRLRFLQPPVSPVASPYSRQVPTAASPYIRRRTRSANRWGKREPT